MMFSLSFKIMVDRAVFGIAAYFLDRLSFIIGHLKKRDHSITKDNIKNVVIAKYLGLGSIVRAQIVVKNIRETFPACKIHFLTSKKNKSIFEIMDNIDNVITIDDNNIISMILSTFSVVKVLLSNRIDAFIDLEVYSRYSSCITVLSCARNRYGFFRHDIHLNLGIYTHLLYFNNHVNITDIYLQISGLFTNNLNTNKDIPKFNFKEENIQEVYEYFKNKLFLKDKNTIYIGINANASDLALERRYPPSYFIKLINMLTANMEKKVMIFLVGSPSEKDYLSNDIYNHLDENAKKLTFITAGVFSLTSSIYLLSYFDLFITTDSGPLHFAYSQDIRIVSIWGPVIHNHYGVNDYSKEQCITSNVYCSPCIHIANTPPCSGNNVCMKSISPYVIYNNISDILNLQRFDREMEEFSLFKENISGYYLGSVIRPDQTRPDQTRIN